MIARDYMAPSVSVLNCEFRDMLLSGSGDGIVIEEGEELTEEWV